jgi:hypothetical protein
MSIPVIKGCAPVAGPWPVRCEVAGTEVFVDRRATDVNHVFVNETIVLQVDRWERGELVEIFEIRGRR